MRLSKTFFRTLRDAPKDVESRSHELMIRAGYIQQLAAGVFSYMPIGWRSIEKIKKIIRDEMALAGAYEVNMPVVQPYSLWEESGRSTTFRPPLASFKDKRDTKMVLAPTHEEAVVALARFAITSYRNMPTTIFQIQTKFRDEIRPRGGLLRTREFEMKDAYSFDVDEEGMAVSFDTMAKAYRAIFNKVELDFIEVGADSGGIGGSESREFIALAENGEDTVIVCSNTTCGYAANREKASFRTKVDTTEDLLELEEVVTPDANTIEKLCNVAGVKPTKTAKALFYKTTKDKTNQTLIVAIVRGDHKLNLTKLCNLVGESELTLADKETITAHGFVPGYASPVGIRKTGVITVVDTVVAKSKNLVSGANKPGLHLKNVNVGRDYTPDYTGDITLAGEGDNCVECGDLLLAKRGIEMGHIFKLGDVYSSKMELKVADKKGGFITPYMGCYGIGIGRMLAASIEAHNDKEGIALPESIAPFRVGVIGLDLKDEKVRKVAENIYLDLKNSGVDVVFDDLDDQPGVKFKNMDLIGVPTQIVVGARGLKDSTVEIKRRSQNKTKVGVEQVLEKLLLVTKRTL